MRMSTARGCKVVFVFRVWGWGCDRTPLTPQLTSAAFSSQSRNTSYRITSDQRAELWSNVHKLYGMGKQSATCEGHVHRPIVYIYIYICLLMLCASLTHLLHRCLDMHSSFHIVCAFAFTSFARYCPFRTAWQTISLRPIIVHPLRVPISKDKP